MEHIPSRILKAVEQLWRIPCSYRDDKDDGWKEDIKGIEMEILISNQFQNV